jgi:hypothetical protein
MTSFTQEQAREIVLSRQGLLARYSDPLDAVRAMIAVQTQYAASLGVAVASRTNSLAKGWDEKAIDLDGPLVKSWSVRHTLHAHTREDHAMLLGIVGSRFGPKVTEWMRAVGCLELLPKVEAALQNGPLNRKELHDRVPEFRGVPMVGWGLDVKEIAFRGRLCIIGKGAGQKFVLIEKPTSDLGLPDLVKRYLESYGPATIYDFRRWSGLPMKDVRAAFKEAEAELVRCEIQGMDGERWGYNLPSPGGRPLGLRLLAKFDPLILAYEDKTLLLPSQDHARVFRIAGQVEATVLIDGIVGGTWRMARAAGYTELSVEPHRKLSRGERSALEAEARDLVGKLHLPQARVTYAE